MAIVKDTVANFIGGVSQQPDKLMYPNQSKEIENFLLAPSVGMKDRPPSEHIARLIDAQAIHPLCHTIIKEDEEYEVILTGTDVKVFDLEGNPKGVTINIEPAIEGETYEALYSENVSGRKIIFPEGKTKKSEIVNQDVSAYYEYTIGIYTVYFIGSYKYQKYKSGGTTRYRDVWDTINEGYKVYLDAECTQLFGYIKTLDTDNQKATIFLYNTDEPEYNPAAYIINDNPIQNLKMITIADYTFILNTTINTALTNELYYNPHPASALIFVRQGNYTTDHKITVNGTLVADYTTTSDLETTKTNVITQNLYDNLVTNLGTTDWKITKQGSVILLERRDQSPFTITAEDSNGNNDLYVWYKSADSVDVLPVVAPNGYILKITGEDVNKNDDYYVQFETSDSSAFGNGTWKECPAPDIPYKINAKTMPHALIRQEDGKFSLQTIDWTPRGAGDEETAPTPSFIGNTIQDVYTHKGRLAFISMDKTIFSDTQDIFSFFKKTTVAELDTDPIDVGSNSKMVLLKHNLPFNEELLLFSETSVFSIKGGDVFSNATVACDLTMEYPCSRFVKPINAGGTGFFLFENGDYSRVMEIFITSTYTIDAREVTEQVPSYVPSQVYKIAGSTANNLACFLSTKETNSVYVYNYYYSSEQKAQSAWSKWSFEGKVLNVDFHNHLMYLVIQYEDGIYLEKLNFTAQYKEKDLDYLFHLDRKVYIDEVTIDEENEKTTFTLPYPYKQGIIVLDSKGFPLEYEVENNTITVNYIKDRFIIGFPYFRHWRMPLIYYRQQSQTGTKVVEGTLMLRDINLCYADTGYFKIIVTPEYNTNITSEFEFTGKIVGMKSATIGQINVSSGTFLLPVIARNEEINIDVISDSYLPSCFLSLEWLGDFVVRGQ